MIGPANGMDRRAFLSGAAAAVLNPMQAAQASPSPSTLTLEQEAQAFLKTYVEGWLPLETRANEAASWQALTDVSPNRTEEQTARNLELAQYMGRPEFIKMMRGLVEHQAELEPLTIRQFEKARLRAAEAPKTMPDLVKARAQTEANQSAIQDGNQFSFKRDGREPPRTPRKPT